MPNQGQAGEDRIKPGIYEQLVTEELGRLLRGLDDDLVSREPLDPADSHEVLTRHLATLVTRALRSVPAGSQKPLLEQVRLANRIVGAIAGAVSDDHLNDLVAESADVLHAIAARIDTPAPVRFPDRPEIPLSASALLVNGREQPGIGTEVRRELASADRVDLLCAFVKWHGLRVLEDAIEALTRRGGRLRVITTTYIGATERRALDRLAELGLLSPFQYFGIADNTQLKTIHWKRGRGNDPTGLEKVYTGDDARARIVAQAVKDKVTSIPAMRAIGFCVGEIVGDRR